MTGHIQVFPGVILQIVIVQMQLSAVDKVRLSCENLRLFALESLIKGRRHRRFDADEGNVLTGDSHGLDHLVGAVACAQIEAQLIQSRLAQRAQILLRSQGSVGVHVLMHARGMEGADHAVVLFNFHKRFQIHIGDTRGLLLDR